MLWQPTVKAPAQGNMAPHLQDYPQACAMFSWARARQELDGLPGGAGLNIAHEAVDRHAAGPRGDRVAIRWISRAGAVRDFTYAHLRSLTNCFANVLERLRVRMMDRVFVLTNRIPELYVAALGALKNRSIFCPLCSALESESIRACLEIGQAQVLVTTEQLYQRKVAAFRSSLPFLQHVILISENYHTTQLPGTMDFSMLIQTSRDHFTIKPTDPEDFALLQFTSGTAGTAKGAVHVHEAAVAHHATGKLALDLHDNDTFWCTADPGWVTGTSCGIIAPLTQGVTSIINEGDFDAARCYRILQDHKVSVWCTTPGTIRMLMRAGAELAHQYDLSALRFLASVGEPLNPEAVIWGQRAFGLPFHDNWLQAETGGIMVANYASMDIRPGSMGKPLPGIEAAVVQQHEDGSVTVVEQPNVVGELALGPGWPSMFRGYWGETERYRKCFAGGWYLTGDLVKRDADGYFWFVGRKDDVIHTSGHLKACELGLLEGDMSTLDNFGGKPTGEVA